jgi:hypothetical protein
MNLCPDGGTYLFLFPTDVSQLLSEYKELVGIVKTVSSLQEQ